MLGVIIGSSVILASIICWVIIRLTGQKILDTVLGIICIVFSSFALLIGLVVVPLAVEEYSEYEELHNYSIVHNDHAVIIDISNSPQDYYPHLFKFDRHLSVTEIGDSTKYFLERERSFYGVTVTKHVVWSNPPYQNYNRD